MIKIKCYVDLKGNVRFVDFPKQYYDSLGGNWNF